MALISCPKCGKQISDKAAACPHCGASFSPAANYTDPAGNTDPLRQAPTYGVPAQQSPAKPRSKAPVVIGIIAGVAVVVLAIILIFANSGEQPGGGTPGNVYTPNENKLREYSVTLAVENTENLFINQYNIDILIDDKFLDTLPNGYSKNYTLNLTEGSHKVEFRLNNVSIVTGENLYNVNDPSSYKITTIHVDNDGTIRYHVEIDFGNNLNVTTY